MYVCLPTKAGHFAEILPAVCSSYSNTKYAWVTSCVKVALKLIFQGPVRSAFIVRIIAENDH